MTAFSAGVICQTLLALRHTKEVKVGERAREGKVKYDWKFWGQVEEVALLYEQKRRFLPVSCEEERSRGTDYI